MSALDTSEAMMREVMAHLRKTGARWRSDAVRDVIAERDRLRAVNAELLAALRALLVNAETITDPRMDHATNCVALSFDDLAMVRAAIALATEGEP